MADRKKDNGKPKTPSVGGGLAENARRKLRDRGDVIARRVDKATSGNGNRKRDDE